MKDTSLNKKELFQRLETGEPVSITFRFINEKLLVVFNSIMAKMLAKKDQIFLLNSLVTITREVIINALKANAKRVYFIKKNLDINNQEEYQRGMKKFKDEVIGDFDTIESDLLRSDFYVKTIFSFAKNVFTIKVINNSPILQEELDRINLRISKAIEYNDFSEAYEEIADESEGAGLGIVLTILLLKNMGIDPKNYKIATDGKVTATYVVIPRELRPSTITTDIKDQIIREIDEIPTFPENILELQRMCHDPNSSIEKISSRITLDPALTSNVIKLSNSAGIAAGKRIDDIKTAVMTIGLKNLDAILTASNARRILNERYATFEVIWEHCNRVAFYARNIALSKKLSGVVEKAYMGGLLHDLGKIVLLATDKKLVNRIADIVKNKKISATTIMEEISIGISHSSIGALIAEKWNFPEYLVKTIKFHHSPLESPKEFSEVLNTVYIANMMAGIETRKYSFYYLEESILERFGMQKEITFNAFHDKLQKKYEAMKLHIS